MVRVTEGSATVHLYATPSGRRKSWTISYYLDGRRRRQKFSSLTAARTAARDIATRLAAGEAQVLAATPEDLAAWSRAVELAAPTGEPLESMAAEYAQAMAMLDGIDPRPRLADVVSDYLRRHPKQLVQRTVAQCVAELVEARRQDGCGPRHLRDLAQRLERFARDFACPITSVDGRAIDAWLRALRTGQGQQAAPRTRNNFRSHIANLFAFARRRGYLPWDHAELESVELAVEPRIEIEIFTPLELRWILDHALPSILPVIALGAFAGLRTSEAERIDWRAIDLDRGWLAVPVPSKTGRRVVPLCESLVQWLMPHSRPGGRVCPLANTAATFKRLEMKIRKAHPDFRWKRNGLRHSFVSYRVAETQDLARVALESGNSPRILQEHYLELVTPAQARAWFDVRPQGAREKVVPLSFG